MLVFLVLICEVDVRMVEMVGRPGENMIVFISRGDVLGGPGDRGNWS